MSPKDGGPPVIGLLGNIDLATSQDRPRPTRLCPLILEGQMISSTGHTKVRRQTVEVEMMPATPARSGWIRHADLLMACRCQTDIVGLIMLYDVTLCNIF